MKNIQEIIDITVAKAKTYPDRTEPCIEYNLELPEDENIKKDSWYGIPAKYNPDMTKNTANITYKL